MCLLYAWHCVKCFPRTNSFNPHTSLGDKDTCHFMLEMIKLKDTEARDFFQVTKLISGPVVWFQNLASWSTKQGKCFASFSPLYSGFSSVTSLLF